MTFPNFDAIKNLFSSWGLLSTLTLATLFLWLIPDSYLLDASVATVRNTYRGEIGFVAIALVVLLVSKIITTVCQTGWEHRHIISNFLKRRHAVRKHRKKVLRGLSKLGVSERDLLLELYRKGKPSHELPEKDPRLKKLYDAELIKLYNHEEDSWSFQVHDWVWKELWERLNEDLNAPRCDQFERPTRE